MVHVRVAHRVIHVGSREVVEPNEGFLFQSLSKLRQAVALAIVAINPVL